MQSKVVRANTPNPNPNQPPNPNPYNIVLGGMLNGVTYTVTPGVKPTMTRVDTGNNDLFSPITNLITTLQDEKFYLNVGGIVAGLVLSFLALNAIMNAEINKVKSNFRFKK